MDNTIPNPWVLEQLLSDPNNSYADIVPTCDLCGFTFLRTACQRSGPGLSSHRCNTCRGLLNASITDTWPCCWGPLHPHSPIPLSRAHFRSGLSKTLCDLCIVELGDSPAVHYGLQLPIYPRPDEPYPPCLIPEHQPIYDALVLLQNVEVKIPTELVPYVAARMEGDVDPGTITVAAPGTIVKITSDDGTRVCMKHVAWYEERFKNLLQLWLTYLFCLGGHHPMRCLNCYRHLPGDTKFPICEECRGINVTSVWLDFRICPTCCMLHKCDMFHLQSNTPAPGQAPRVFCSVCTTWLVGN